MSAILDIAIKTDRQRWADCERTDREMNAHLHPTFAQVLNSFATYAATPSGPAAVFSPDDVHAALLQLESGLADWISAHDGDKLGCDVSLALDLAINEIGNIIKPMGA